MRAGRAADAFLLLVGKFILVAHWGLELLFCKIFFLDILASGSTASYPLAPYALLFWAFIACVPTYVVAPFTTAALRAVLKPAPDRRARGGRF